MTSLRNMAEASWLLYSFNVKMDGQQVCRLMDKMTCNAGNTVCLGGELQAPGAPPPMQGPPPEDPKCKKLREEIERLINTVRAPTPKGGFPQGYQGLATRWAEMAENKGNWTAGKKLEGHRAAYRQGRSKLEETLKKWDDRDCDKKGGPPLPQLTREYAEQIRFPVAH